VSGPATGPQRGGIVLVTPALADANNGNWQTARRWAAMLRQMAPGAPLALLPRWEPGTGHDGAALLLALHARRSAASVQAWKAAHPDRPLVLALTGTDLYRDIDTDAAAQRSLALADRLIVLNALGPQRLPAPLRARCHVVLQSCPAHRPLPRPAGHLRALVVGHLRPEKDPLTALRAAARLAQRPDIRLDLAGGVLDPALGAAAQALAARTPGVRLLGALPHRAVRRRIAAASVLVHPSVVEGGAHVVIEALRSGTPVLASRIDGNVGLLGADHPALFEPGDDAALARWLQRLRDDPAMLARLAARSAALAPRFAPAAEAAALHAALSPFLQFRPAPRLPPPRTRP
jgi:putative glycosyltransferase (TIGR04348 family)